MGELEEQMQQMEEEDEKEREKLQTRIQQLEADVDRYSRSILSWSAKCQRLENDLSNERALRAKVEERMESSREIDSKENDVVRLRPRNASRGTSRGIDTTQRSIRGAAAQEEVAFLGCGNCSAETRCECIEQVFEIGGIADDLIYHSYKRPHSPTLVAESKKVRQSSVPDVQPNEEREIDFTERFSTKCPAALTSAATNTAPDPCGFCQDGTPCICAEMTAEDRRPHNSIERLAFQSIPKPLEPLENPCVNGPGTCQQCRSDANSTLFCKSLAASRKKTRAQTSTAQTSGTIMPQTGSTSQKSIEQATFGISLSCADAYATLSRHPAYERASEEPGAWLPKLAAKSGGAERTAFEVEAASVMQTLRFFDRRFGRKA